MIKQISLEEAINFRKRVPFNPLPVYDSWDEKSEQLGYFLEEKLNGVVRISKEENGRLPLSKYFPKAKIEKGSTEISGLMISHMKNFRATYNIAHYLNKKFENYESKIYIDVLIDGKIKLSSYEKFGFEKTNYWYFNPTYNRGSLIMVRNNQNKNYKIQRDILI